MINAGKDKGKTGTVTEVYRKKNRVIVEGLNLVKKHIKRTENNPGGIITMEAGIHVSSVQCLDPITGAPCKIGLRYLEDGTKVRISRGGNASGTVIPKPELAKKRRVPLPTSDDGYVQTTPVNVVHKVTRETPAAEEGSQYNGDTTLLELAMRNLNMETALRQEYDAHQKKQNREYPIAKARRKREEFLSKHAKFS